MNKLIPYLLASACCLSAYAAVRQQWTVNVDSSIPEPHSIHAYHGETIDMAATLKSYGQPMTAASTARFLWQTNGMGNAWWQTNATCSAGVVRARFTPAMDPGANAVTFFLEVTDSDGSAFRPNGKIILSRSPGTNPETADLPPPGGSIDFARVTYINAPWCTLEAAEAAVESGVQRSLKAVESLSNAVDQTYAKLTDIPDVPSIAGLATTGEVAAAAASVLLAAEQSAASRYQPLAGMADYARKSDLPTDYLTKTNLSSYATKGYADDAAAAAKAAAESTAARTYQPLSAMANYPQRHEVPTVNLSGRNLTVNGNSVNIPLPGESGSVISDGTNAIDAAGNTYTNGVVSGKLRARNDRIWGDYGFSNPTSNIAGIIFDNWSSAGQDDDPDLYLITFHDSSDSYYHYNFPPDPEWLSVTIPANEIYSMSGEPWSYGDLTFTRRPLFDRFALESQLSGSSLDTNTVAEIANHAIATNATVSGALQMTNETGTAHVGWDGDILTFSYGISVNQSPSSFASTEGTLFGGESLQSLLDEKADVAELEYVISTNNPAFVSAVLSTGLNIDTNDVAVIKEFVEKWPVDPATGATTLGGLLTAIAAAIAWLKKNKRDLSNRQWGERTFSNPVASLEGAVFNRIDPEHDTEYALFFNYDGESWHGYFDPRVVGDDWLSITLDKNNIFSDVEPRWDESLGGVTFTRTATQDTFALTSELPEVPTDAKITSLAREACAVNPGTSLALKDQYCCLVAYDEGMTFTFAAKEEGQTGLRSFEVIVTGCVKDGAVNWPAVTYRGDSADLIPEDGDNHWTFAEQQDGSFAVTRHVANTFMIGE